MQVRTLLLALFLQFSLFSYSQNPEIDSIRKTIQLEPTPDTASLKSIFRITSAFTRLNADSALKYGELGITVARELNDSSRLFLAYRKLGRIQGVFMRDMEGALKNARLALALAEKMGDPAKITKASLEVAMTWPAISMDEAMDYGNQAIQQLEGIEEKTKLIYNDLVDAYGFVSYLYTHSDLTESIVMRKKAASYARQAQDSNRLAIQYAAMGDLFKNPEPDSGIHFFKLALGIFDRQNNLGNLGQIYTRIAGIFMNQDQMDSSIYFTQKSLELAEKTGNRRLQSQNYDQLASLWLQQKEYDEALFYAHKWLESERENPSEQLPIVLNELGNIYFQMNDLPKASSAYEELKVEAQKFNSKRYEALALYGLGKVALLEKNYQDALYLFMDSDKLYKEQGDSSLQNTFQIGRCFFYMKAYGASKSYFIDFLNDEDIPYNYQLEAYRAVARCDSALGNMESAFNYLNAYHELKIEQVEQQFSSNVAKAQSELKTELKETQIRELEQKEEIQALEIAQTQARSNFFLTLAIILGLAALAVAYLFFRLRQNKRQIESQAAELQDLNSTKDRLFGIIAHDLHGPVSGFQALGKIFSHHLKKGNTEKLLAISNRVEKQSIQLKTLLDNLLQWSLQQLGTYRPQWEQVLIKPLGQEVVAMYEESSSAKENEIEVKIPENLSWKADKNGLRVVLNNLLNNAIKFTDKGKIRLQAHQEANQLQIEISDTGSGMTAEQLAEFRQKGSLASQKGTAGEAGTGLGLNLVYQLIQRWGGEMKIQSEIEKGTRVQVYLPVG